MDRLVGTIRNYYRTIGVASVNVCSVLHVGDQIHIKGHTTDFDQEVESLQVAHQQVLSASQGQTAGLKVSGFVRKNDRVFMRQVPLNRG